ncbi:MAG: hypothetical protein LBO67_01305 [Spirochaetaceae bacterium]|jgi:hypothetical protein|nr:hypothetical protein [Spirochaetaceae bacterium]
MKSPLELQIEGKPALGFDTGLTADAFAKARLAPFIARLGYAVKPDGSVQVWQPFGVIEQNHTICLAGPFFAGVPMDTLIAESDSFLTVLRRWMAARLHLGTSLDGLAVYPAGALVANDGTILFPPEWIMRRSVEVAGTWLTGAEQWTHPDLTGPAADTFTAAALAYRIFCKTAPFPAQEKQVLRQDIREAVFLPAHLAEAGLNMDLARCINDCLSGKIKTLSRLQNSIGEQTPVAQFFSPVTEENRLKREREKEQYAKRLRTRTKSRRFLTRNTTILTGSGIAVLLVALIVGSFIQDNAKQPTTAGMQPLEVVQTYYDSFGRLDHTMMSACLLKDAVAKNDITSVSSYYVITKMRQAYETASPPVLVPAQEWLDAGPAHYASVPEGQLIVFGVSDCRITPLESDESDGEVSFRADYRFWAPSEADSLLFSARANTDTLRVVLHKGAWRITEIERESSAEAQSAQ